jgi:hypothetical protein
MSPKNNEQHANRQASSESAATDEETARSDTDRDRAESQYARGWATAEDSGEDSPGSEEQSMTSNGAQ